MLERWRLKEKAEEDTTSTTTSAMASRPGRLPLAFSWWEEGEGGERGEEENVWYITSQL